jgi:aminoglycoside 3-N-acetyltransferase I
MQISIQRLTPHDIREAGTLFQVLTTAFDEPSRALSDTYLHEILSRTDFWALAAIDQGDIVGGLTAHTLPMTQSESEELFIYDVAVRCDCRRRGVGAALLGSLRTLAKAEGIDSIFVAADSDDSHALEFYRYCGGAAASAVLFSFTTG